MVKRFILALFLASPVYSDQVAVSTFKGLNNNESSVIIGPEYAQDALNIDVTPGGKSIKKRPGYGLYKTLTTSQGIHGGIHFFDSTGNDVQVWGSSTSLWGIVTDGTPTQLISSATLNSTWDCADIQGSAYCVNSNRDAIIKTNGATINWYTTPLGTMVEATPDRLAIGGVAAAPSSIYISASNSFTNFTAAPLTTDPFIEPIAAPGSKLTHLRWACGKLLWWKDQSFGSFDFNDQYSAELKIISDTVGTFDNTSAIDPGGSVWFRGQDGHIWEYDCSGLIKQSIEITPFVQASGRRTANSWTQTSESDFNGGATIPVLTLSTAIVPGQITTSSYSVTETGSASGWSSGSASNATVGTSSISISINNSGTATNPGFESSFTGNWTNSGSVSFNQVANTTGDCGTINPQEGSNFASGTCNNGGLCTTQAFQVLDLSGNVIDSVTIPYNGDCSWRQLTFTPQASNLRRRVKFRINVTFSGGTIILTTSDSYILGGSLTFYYNTAAGLPNQRVNIDNIQSGSSTITSGSFTSQTFNTGVPYSFVYATAAWTTSTSTPTFYFQKSPDAASWTNITSSTGTNIQSNQRYLRYVASFTVSGTDDARSYIQGVQIITQSSGTFYSAVKNAPNLASWSTFNANASNGDGAHNFFMRAAANSFTTTASVPMWASQTNGAQVSTATGVYFQVIDSFTITAATNTAPTLSDFTVNWFEGNATDQAYMHYFDNAIWASVSYGVGVSSNTYIFKRDLINDAWTVYNIGTGGMVTQNAHLFFGDVASTGKIFQYGSGTSDNGNSIVARWKSKDFTGADPFNQSQLNQIDTFATRNAGQSITSTYAMDTSTTTTSYTIGLSSATSSIIQNRKNVPVKLGNTFNIQYGDSSTTSQWEILGYRISFTQLPWRPTQ